MPPVLTKRPFAPYPGATITPELLALLAANGLHVVTPPIHGTDARTMELHHG